MGKRGQSRKSATGQELGADSSSLPVLFSLSPPASAQKGVSNPGHEHGWGCDSNPTYLLCTLGWFLNFSESQSPALCNREQVQCD